MELNKVLQHVAGRDGSRMIVLTGVGSVFSSGYDLAEAGGRRNIESGNPTVEDGLERRRRIVQLINTIYNHPLPIISAGNGYALAGGSELALICDLTFAIDDAQFGYAGIRMGVVVFTNLSFCNGDETGAGTHVQWGAVPTDELMSIVNEEIEEIRKTPGYCLVIGSSLPQREFGRQVLDSVVACCSSGRRR